MRVSAKADYAVRAAIELAAAEGRLVKGDHIAGAQGIPLNFLENILVDLKQAGLVGSRRGPEGGYWLDRPADEVSVADVMRAAEGPLASVRGERPEALSYDGAAEPLQEVWIALRANVRGILEQVTLADVVAGRLPRSVRSAARDPDARLRR
ncbi:MAG TPA: Rrf2 family transcriptional regulator [Solirubrobacteraceae bacterium]|jgi:Rrf2 family protein|nr:Rrf2 family transcriptional regulator [Solirubrobacteraceae bacterium]